MNKKSYKRNLILKTFIDLTIFHGYNNISINKIIKTCNISKGSFYTYFSSKAEMVNICLNMFITEMTNQFWERYQRSKNLDDFLYNYLLPPSFITLEQYKFIVFFHTFSRSTELLDKECFKKIKEIHTIRFNNHKKILLKFLDETIITDKNLEDYVRALITIKDSYLAYHFIDNEGDIFRFRPFEEFIEFCKNTRNQEKSNFFTSNTKKILTLQ